MGFRGAVAAIRLRRILSFLRRHGLYDTAHWYSLSLLAPVIGFIQLDCGLVAGLRARTGVFFDAPYLRRMLLAGCWDDASFYVLGFITVAHCSREADNLLLRILLRVMADLADGRAPVLFQRLYDSLQAQPDSHHLRRILLSMRSDPTRASTLYHRLKPMAVQIVLNLIATCPELKARTRFTLDHTTNMMSLAPGLSAGSWYLKKKASSIPANIIARSFLRKRPPLIIHEVNHPGDTLAERTSFGAQSRAPR